MLLPGQNTGSPEPDFNPRAQTIIEELNNLLQNVYADLEIPRDKVSEVAQRGRDLAAAPEIWAKTPGESQEFLDALDRLEKKINQTLDLKRLKEEGLVKAVKF